MHLHLAFDSRVSVFSQEFAAHREKERNYKLRKELFALTDNKIAVQFWYEYQDAHDGMKWKRYCAWLHVFRLSELAPTRCTYQNLGSDDLEDWTFVPDGRMHKRQMSGNDVPITDDFQRWYRACESEEDLDSIRIDKARR